MMLTDTEVDIIIAKQLGWSESPFSNYPWQLRPPGTPIHGNVRIIPRYIEMLIKLLKERKDE